MPAAQAPAAIGPKPIPTEDEMKKATVHFEPYVHLAGLTDTSALIAWGGFFFVPDDGADRLRLVHDHELDDLRLGRTQTIGERSEPYGRACVRVVDRHGRVVSELVTRDANHTVVENLRPDTDYEYRITLAGRDFLGNPPRDWRFDGRGHPLGLVPTRRRYDTRFRTFPAPDRPANVSFAVIGDYGVGIHKGGDGARRQRETAAAMESAVDEFGVRLVVTTGDNVYLDKTRRDGSGAEDDDWFFAFYQPYRYVIAKVPFYPTAGNHDTDDSESSDDRTQLLDNFHLRRRFAAQSRDDIGCLEPALVYSFSAGASLRFLCLDSTMDERAHRRFVELEPFRTLVDKALAEARRASQPAWCVVFSHHPPFCAGPRYGNDDPMCRSVVPLVEATPGAVMFSGHEHNFQHARVNGVDYFVTGAGGKLSSDPPDRFTEAGTEAWATVGHFVLVSAGPGRMTVTPITLNRSGRPGPLALHRPDGRRASSQIVLRDRRARFERSTRSAKVTTVPAPRPGPFTG